MRFQNVLNSAGCLKLPETRRSGLEAAALLRTVFPSEQPYEKEGALHLTWLSLNLKSDGTVACVRRGASTVWPEGETVPARGVPSVKADRQ